MTYEERINLAKSHLLHARVQTQAALQLLAMPGEGEKLEEPDYQRIAILGAVGGHLSAVTEDINCDLATRSEPEYPEYRPLYRSFDSN